ncbi:MAG: hypothetical protein LDL30_10770 [Desulfovibrio sp.]|nr:hypothetical protein [Desulfovibrio sp.]MCA1986299.1 hypothetical protein [Desulfovibrio sp.]
MHTALVITLTAASGWEFWPFDAAYPMGFWPFVAKIAFVAVIFGGVILYLRALFGPGGRLRPEGLETIQEAKAREARERQALLDAEAAAKAAENPPGATELPASSGTPEQ